MGTFKPKVEWSQLLRRYIRKDSPQQLGVSSWLLLEEAINDDRTKEALHLIDYIHDHEGAELHHFARNWMWANQTYIADLFGEAAFEKMFRAIEEEGRGRRPSGWWQGVPPELQKPERIEDLIKKQAEQMRAHYPPAGSITIFEEEDRYVMDFNPCNSGGHMLRAGMTKGAWNLGVTKEPHAWSWSKPGKPYYCIHCSLGRGIIGTEEKGYPFRVHETPGHAFNPDIDHPYNPCRMIFYKQPELIPESYYRDLGIVKYKKKGKKPL